MSHLENIRNLHKRVADNAFGETVTVLRVEPSGASPQASYSPGSGTMGTSQGGTFTATAIRAPVDLVETASGLIEAQPWTFTRADLDFPIAEGDYLIPASGANAEQRLLVVKTGHKAAGSCTVVHTAIASGAAGLDSSGDDF